MLENDGTLPLPDSVKKVNVFGHGSIDWYYMSSGSERVGMDGQTSYDFNQALEHYGIEVNQELPTYYKKWHKAEGDSNTIMASYDSFYQVREPGLENNTEYETIYQNARSYSDTAFMVISRHAGENSDCPHYQTKCEGQPTDNERTYLQISTEEEYTLRQIAEDFENVIVIINSTNAMQLDFLQDIDGIDACISVGATGVQGALSIPEILWGDASPSGHLTDTYPYKHEYNITYYRGNAKFTRQYQGGKAQECRTMGAGGSAFFQTSCYVEYNEGIYVGYRWFETADVEGFWDDYGGYDSVVQYPFGYGMSYTTFDWTLKSVDIPEGSSITNADKINLVVNVKNTGSVAGKEVAQVYVQAPKGRLEKPAQELKSFAKTRELKPGESQVLTMVIPVRDLASFDEANSQWLTEAGTYTFRIGASSRDIKATASLKLSEYTEKTSNALAPQQKLRLLQ